MHSKFCPICHERTPHKRQFGIGTLILFIVTCGFWLLAMPFYPVRCGRCGGGSLAQAGAALSQSELMGTLAARARALEPHHIVLGIIGVLLALWIVNLAGIW